MTPIEQAIEALEYSKSNASGCTCHSAYRTRQMTDPSCAACEYSEVMQGVDCAIAALRSMEGKEPVPGDHPFRAEENEYNKGSFGVYGPHYSVAGLVNMHAAEVLADRMNWAYRLGRDNNPSPSEPPTYVYSKDYEALYDLLMRGGKKEVLGKLIEDNWLKPCWVKSVRHKSGDLHLFISNIGHFTASDKDFFLSECQRLNLEWIAPTSEPRLTVDEAMEVVREELQKACGINGIIGSQHEDFLRKSRVRLTILQSMSLRP